MRRPVIVVDAGGLDVATPRGGQFRYVADLVRGLADVAPPARFVFLGGSPAPAPELAAVFGAGDRWRYTHFPRPAGRGAMYREQLRLAAVLWRVRANLYHGLHTVVPVLAPCPVVMTVLDLMYELFPEYAAATRSRPYRLYRWGVRNRVRRAVCISQTTADDVRRRWRVDRRRLDLVYLGTTFSSVVREEGFAAADGGPFLLSPYNLEPRKNLGALLKAFAGLRGRHPNLRLVLYGRAGVTEAREQAFLGSASELGVGSAVVRTGRVSEEELGALYRRAEIFVFPSLYEGFGYPVLEAMGAGACVVTRAASAMAEVVGDAGVTVETADPPLLAAAIGRLLAAPDERTRFGVRAQARAAEFTVRRMAEQTWRTYTRALQPGSN